MEYRKYRYPALYALFLAYPFLLGMDYATYQASQIKDITTIHPLALTALIITSAFMLTLPRQKAIVPFFIMLMLIPMNQVIAVATLDFFLYRILIIISLIRLTLRSEFYPQTKNKIDKTIYLFVISMCIIYTLQWQTASAIINRAGYALDIIGSYILFRSFIRDFEDIDRLIKVFVFISIILAFSMAIEHLAQINIFSIFGSISKDVYFRDGRIRSVGSFGNAIYIGTYGAVILPLFVYLWNRNRKLSIAGIISATIITLTSSSSGPILTFVAAIVALFIYPFKAHMRKIRWGILFLIISLHLYMKAPVWALIDRVSVFGASSNYHRFLLIDNFINRFNEWWLLGTKSTEHWWDTGTNPWDLANQFVRIGVDGGFITFIIFILIFIYCFRSIGRSIKLSAITSNRYYFVLMWTAGAMLFANMVAFMGVSYYGQIFFVWILNIALISTISDLSKNQSTINKQTNE